VVQRDVAAKDLRPDQIIAAIYTVIDQDKVSSPPWCCPGPGAD